MLTSTSTYVFWHKDSNGDVSINEFLQVTQLDDRVWSGEEWRSLKITLGSATRGRGVPITAVGDQGLEAGFAVGQKILSINGTDVRGKVKGEVDDIVKKSGTLVVEVGALEMKDSGHLHLLLCVLKAMCEGNNTVVQDYLRAQPDNMASKNIVEMLSSTLGLLVQDAQDMSENTPLIVQTLSTITEFVQGNQLNQRAVFDAHIIDHVNSIIRTNSDKKEKRVRRLFAKFDEDSNGMVTVKEVENYAKENGIRQVSLLKQRLGLKPASEVSFEAFVTKYTAGELDMLNRGTGTDEVHLFASLSGNSSTVSASEATKYARRENVDESKLKRALGLEAAAEVSTEVFVAKYAAGELDMLDPYIEKEVSATAGHVCRNTILNYYPSARRSTAPAPHVSAPRAKAQCQDSGGLATDRYATVALR